MGQIVKPENSGLILVWSAALVRRIQAFLAAIKKCKSDSGWMIPRHP